MTLPYNGVCDKLQFKNILAIILCFFYNTDISLQKEVNL